MRLSSTLLLAIIIGIVACDPNRIYEENIDLEDALWKVADVPNFQFEIDDVSTTYDLHFNIRSTASYPFNNIYVKYNLTDSLDTVLASETKEYYLFDPKTGEPFGDGLGDLFDNRFPLVKAYSFSHPGKYKVNFQQFMRLDSLPMVVSIGLRIETSTSQEVE